MNKLFASSLLSVSVMFLGTSAHAETLTLPWTSGFELPIGSPNCTEGPTGGAEYISPTYCLLAMPVPVAAGKTIRQITAIYANNQGGGPVSLDVLLQTRDLAVNAPSTYWQAKFAWTASGNASPITAYGNIMQQFGVPPFTSYPDAFAVDSSVAYRAIVSIGPHTDFLGLKIDYR